MLESSLVAVGKGELGNALPNAPYGPEEVLRRFFMSRTKDTLDAYKRDVGLFARWRGTTSAGAVAELLSGGSARANALALEWLDSMGELAPATRARRLSALKSLVRVAQLLGAVDWSIQIGAPKIDRYRDTAGPSPDRVMSLLSVCGEGVEGLRNRAVVLLAALAGLRRMEISGLNVGDYDHARRWMVVRGKGGKQKGFELSETLRDAVEAWLDARGGEATDPMFLSFSASTFRKRITRKGVYKVVVAVGERAGFKVWPHALRHSAITMGADAVEGDVRALQLFGRHSDPRTTMVYTDQVRDEAGRVMKKIDEKFFRKGT